MAKTTVSARTKNFIATIEATSINSSYGIPWEIKRRITKDNNKIPNVDYEKVLGHITFYEPDKYMCQKVDYEFDKSLTAREILDIIKVVNKFANARDSYIFLSTKPSANEELQRVLDFLGFKEDPVTSGRLIYEKDITNAMAIGMIAGIVVGAIIGLIVSNMPLCVIIATVIGTVVGTIVMKKFNAERDAWRNVRIERKDPSSLIKKK